jgi:hypothetical protein
LKLTGRNRFWRLNNPKNQVDALYATVQNGICYMLSAT